MLNWRQLFGLQSDTAKEARPAEPIAPSGGNGGDVYTHVPETELRASKQHRWLFDDGVQHWNQHRREEDFKPNFAGLNFVKEAAKTRLFGRPADLVGDERVILTGVDWSYAELQGCTLAKSDLRNARLQGADLRNANLAGALLNGADLRDADLRGATLDRAQFARANLTHANLSGASCKDANFAWADLSHAIVGARNLAEANLFGAVRDGVKFERRVPPPMPAYYQPLQPYAQPPHGEIRV